jgi:Flp pilus assembly pilin Flp
VNFKKIRGVTSLEYGLIAAAIAMILITSILALTGQLNAMFLNLEYGFFAGPSPYGQTYFSIDDRYRLDSCGNGPNNECAVLFGATQSGLSAQAYLQNMAQTATSIGFGGDFAGNQFVSGIAPGPNGWGLGNFIVPAGFEATITMTPGTFSSPAGKPVIWALGTNYYTTPSGGLTDQYSTGDTPLTLSSSQLSSLSQSCTSIGGTFLATNYDQFQAYCQSSAGYSRSALVNDFSTTPP